MAIVQYKGMWYDKDEEIKYPQRLNSTCSIDALWKHQIYQGRTAWNFHHNSDTYEPEIVLSNYNYVPPLKKRRWGDPEIFRTEHPLPICSETRDFLWEAGRRVDACLKGF